MVKFDIRDLTAWFGSIPAIISLTMEIYANEILTIIGPSNSGKTTFLRMLNRLNDLDAHFRMQGRVEFDKKDVTTLDAQILRKKVGMVFALPLPLPLSIFDNIAYGARMHGIHNKTRLQEIVESSLKDAYLWEEVKDRLNTSAFKLSGGQQQRLCIARTLAVEPEVILFDEPCSGLDPISTARIEEAILKLKQNYTLVLVTNNVKQAARVGDRTAFFLTCQLIELDKTEKLFTAPSDKRTDDYISGKFG
ncbi:MAG: phosphate ABC transporter ATP-binding protein [Proteobacteria bacterium]|nr:phosphate ABC transporter ATP-binding protein [Pseudomonadota bacterium]